MRRGRGTNKNEKKQSSKCCKENRKSSEGGRTERIKQGMKKDKKGQKKYNRKRYEILTKRNKTPKAVRKIVRT